MPDPRTRQLQLITADGTYGPARPLPPLPRPRLAPLRAPERCILRTLAGFKNLKLLHILPKRMAPEMLLSLDARGKAVRLDSLREAAFWWPLLRKLARAYAGRHSLLLRRQGISPYWRPEPVEW